MKYKIVYDGSNGTKSLANIYADALRDMMRTNVNVVSLDADMMRAVGVDDVAKEFPDRAINVGIQEANMVSFGAGLSSLGKSVYMHTLAPFMTRRCFDQIFISCGYAKHPVVLFGSDPGVCARINGGTHMPFEDIAIMNTIPDAQIVDVSDPTMFNCLLHKAQDAKNVVYFRADRKYSKKIYSEDSEFDFGKGIVVKDGTDVTIITSGVLVEEAIKASAELDKKGVSAAVIDMYSIKPVDRNLIIKYAMKTGAIVTVDNHNTHGGLGDVVASVLSEECPTIMTKLAVNDKYGQVGSIEYLEEQYEIDCPAIIKASEKILNKKNK